MEKTGLVRRICCFCRGRFSNMSLGRTLCIIVVLKLFIIFAVLKLFFFPDFISSKAPDGNKAGYVSSQIVGRAAGRMQQE